MAVYDTLLVTTDLSAPAEAGLRHAAALHERLGSRLIVVFVIDDHLPPVLNAHATDPEALLEQHRAHAEQTLEQHVAKHFPGLPVETVVRQGVVHKEIVSLAQEREVDLIVIGMHGHGFLGHALAGSTTERVLHHATCPVLVVPHRP